MSLVSLLCGLADILVEKSLALLALKPRPRRPHLTPPGWRLRWMIWVDATNGEITIWWLTRPNGTRHAILIGHTGRAHRIERLYPSREWFHPMRN